MAMLCSMWNQLYLNRLSDYPKSLFSRINDVYVFSIKYRYSDILLKNVNFVQAICFAGITLVIVLIWYL